MAFFLHQLYYRLIDNPTIPTTILRAPRFHTSRLHSTAPHNPTFTMRMWQRHDFLEYDTLLVEDTMQIVRDGLKIDYPDHLGVRGKNGHMRLITTHQETEPVKILEGYYQFDWAPLEFKIYSETQAKGAHYPFEADRVRIELIPIPPPGVDTPVHPSLYFQTNPEFAHFDDKGIPTHDAKGESLSANYVRRLVKEQKEYEESYWQAHSAPPS